jgi:hypothetical protein
LPLKLFLLTFCVLFTHLGFELSLLISHSCQFSLFLLFAIGFFLFLPLELGLTLSG